MSLIGARGSTRRHYCEAIALGVILTALSYAVGMSAGWITSLNLLEVFAVFTSYCSTWLCVRERRMNYVYGAISSIAYAVLFFQAGLLASSLLNAYLAPTLLYGWIRWRKDSNTRPVEHVSVKMLPVYIGVAVLFWFGASQLFGALGATMAIFDTMILGLNILAQLLLDNKKLENWYVWAVMNVVAIYVYFSTGLFLVGFQYIFFLMNTVIGFIAWRKSMHEATTPSIPEQPAVAAVPVEA